MYRNNNKTCQYYYVFFSNVLYKYTVSLPQSTVSHIHFWHLIANIGTLANMSTLCETDKISFKCKIDAFSIRLFWTFSPKRKIWEAGDCLISMRNNYSQKSVPIAKALKSHSKRLTVTITRKSQLYCLTWHKAF